MKAYKGKVVWQTNVLLFACFFLCVYDLLASDLFDNIL